MGPASVARPAPEGGDLPLAALVGERDVQAAGPAALTRDGARNRGRGLIAVLLDANQLQGRHDAGGLFLDERFAVRSVQLLDQLGAVELADLARVALVARLDVGLRRLLCRLVAGAAAPGQPALRARHQRPRDDLDDRFRVGGGP